MNRLMPHLKIFDDMSTFVDPGKVKKFIRFRRIRNRPENDEYQGLEPLATKILLKRKLSQNVQIYQTCSNVMSKNSFYLAYRKC